MWPLSYHRLWQAIFFGIRYYAKKIFFLDFQFLVFYPVSNFSNINPEVWRFGKPTKLEIEDGEICGVDAQAQGGSGEIRKAPTT